MEKEFKNEGTARLSKSEYLRKKKEEKRQFVESRYAEHQVNLVYLLKNNSEIRRFTSKNIINTLIDEKIIPADAKSNLVKFNWDKFSVIVDGLGQDYRYTETFFINALVDSFSDFAKSAQKTIDTFMNKEGIAQTKRD